MPPCSRKASMPARSVSTLKLKARMAFTSMKRASVARAQPATSTSMASASLGRNIRSGSTSRISMLSMAISLAGCGGRAGAGGQGADALQRHVNPVGTVIDLVAQLVERLFQLEQAQQPGGVREGGGGRFADRRGIGR